jgi:hypothetical protein
MIGYKTKWKILGRQCRGLFKGAIATLRKYCIGAAIVATMFRTTHRPSTSHLVRWDGASGTRNDARQDGGKENSTVRGWTDTCRQIQTKILTVGLFATNGRTSEIRDAYQILGTHVRDIWFGQSAETGVIPPSVQSYQIAAPDVRTVKLDALVCDLTDVSSQWPL